MSAITASPFRTMFSESAALSAFATLGPGLTPSPHGGVHFRRSILAVHFRLCTSGGVFYRADRRSGKCEYCKSAKKTYITMDLHEHIWHLASWGPFRSEAFKGTCSKWPQINTWPNLSLVRITTYRMWCRAGGQGQVLASTMENSTWYEDDPVCPYIVILFIYGWPQLHCYYLQFLEVRYRVPAPRSLQQNIHFKNKDNIVNNILRLPCTSM